MLSADGEGVVAIHAWAVAVEVRSVNDGLVFVALKVPSLGGFTWILPRPRVMSEAQFRGSHPVRSQNHKNPITWP